MFEQFSSCRFQSINKPHHPVLVLTSRFLRFSMLASSAEQYQLLFNLSGR